MRDLSANTTLILLGHGSTKNDGSEKPVYQHAAELRRRGLFADVREAFWKQEPKVAGVLASALSPRLIIVPLFISEGYFTGEAIPEALGFKQPGEREWGRSQFRDELKGTLPDQEGASARKGDIAFAPLAEGRQECRPSVVPLASSLRQRIMFTRPVGTHPRMTGVLLHRANEVVTQHPFPAQPKPADISLFIAGHGTGRNARSRQAIEHQVELIRQRNEFADVQPCFLEEQPRIAEVPAVAKSRHVVVVPFFVSDGLHVAEDIPILLGEPEKSVRQRLAAGQPTWRNPTERNGKLIWYAAGVGTDPGMAEVILELANEAGNALR